MNKDNVCYYCKTPLANAVGGVVLEHKTPLSRGGDDTEDNLVDACRRCNSRKKKMTENEFREYLIGKGEAVSF